ncbi:thiamine biosynthetic bifunctional enzyme TH1, chloroplastic [Selaginella moellendorffii]|nr:thiamine biosynthetic bifunctional enzyme TH1, chloroplastic [Selaginella moellendorffii]|eukprot:XP_002991097.2 thiamine biosynthetic bifunctional enzyme TH1, chloroplastic [Selaginella moellendorffii]
MMLNLACSFRFKSVTAAAAFSTDSPVHVPCVLTIAGSDSGAGAGIQADIKACAARGVYCCSAITSVTAQNTIGVQGISTLPAAFVEQQINSVLDDIHVDVVKTGMLASPEIIQSVCSRIKQYSIGSLVVDPVMVSTSGHELSGPSILDRLRKALLPLATIVTPNMLEASVLADGKPVNTVLDMREVAAEIHRMGPRYVLVKGGHLKNSHDLVDVLYDGSEWHELRGSRIKTRSTHGTGCTLAASIAAELAKGLDVLPAVMAAKEYVAKALEHSSSIKIGGGAQGPMNHFFQLADWGKLSSRQCRFDPRKLFLYAVTDSGMNKRWDRSTPAAVEQAIQGGATIIQIREKEAETLEFIKIAEASLAIGRKYGVPVLINDRVDVAVACNADGVHLGQTDMPVRLARSILGPGKIIGTSCKTVEQAVKAYEDGADYIGCGGVYPTTTKKKNKTIGLDGLRLLCEASPLPVVAIGGISAANVEEVMNSRPAMLHGVAVVSTLFDQSDVGQATRDLRASMTAALSESTAGKVFS